jgi:hypothetical protein
VKRKSYRNKNDHLLTAFLAAFSAFFLVVAMWSLATPLMASPDEPVQVAKAAAVVRGQFIGQSIGGASSPQSIVKIPATYANLGASFGCYQDEPAIPASCNSQPHTTSKKVIPDTIYNARYQPLYYALVGLPTLFMHSTAGGVYAMRLVSAAMSALFLALAVFAVLKWSNNSRFMLAGIFIASTPSVLFFGGVVNPAGFETSVAICLWTSLLLLAGVRRRSRHIPKGLIALSAISAGIESMTRSLSPFWVVVTLLIVIIATNRSALTRLLHNTGIRVGAALASVGGVVGVAWILIFRATNVVADGYPVAKTASNWTILLTTAQRTTLYYKQIISYFGMLNVPSPHLVYVGWSLLLLVLCLLALYYGTWRQRFSLSALVLAVIAIPIVMAASQARRLGIVWQGSDSLPIFVGIPILATTILSSPTSSAKIWQRVSLPAIALIGGGLSIVAFFGELERYAIGTPGFSFSIIHSAWHPPLGIVGLCVAEVVTMAVITEVYIKLAKSPKRETNMSYMEYELQGILPQGVTHTWYIPRY